MKPSSYLVLLLLLLPLTTVMAEGGATVSEIRFVGNKVTQNQVMLREMVIHVGDPIDSVRIEKSRQAIMNLGLFKSVDASLEEGPVLVITVVERYYILPLPLLDVRPDGSYGYGADLRFDNLAGLNQHLKFSYEEKNSIGSNLPNSTERGVSYTYPRLSDSAYQLDFSTKLKRSVSLSTNPDQSQAHYQNDAWNSTLGASRWANDDGISRGWRYGGGVNYLSNEYTFIDGVPGDRVDGHTVSIYATLDYLNVDDHAFYRDGNAFGVRGELGGPYFDSDFSFSREQVYYRAYHHLTSNDANINSQWQFGFANGCAFGCAAWSLGGTSLRGYDSSYVNGNVFALMNLEYHHPMSGFNQFRGVVFTDIGDAWADMESMTLNHLKSSVGVGFRWTVQSFVNVTLRMDYAYAIDAQTYHAYFSTSASF